MARSYIYPLIIIGILFFVFGFITWLNGILIPYFKICLELTNFQSLWVAFAAYMAYFFMALPSAWILRHTGYKKGMVLGLFVMAAGTIVFLPAAYTRTYYLFLAGLFITGSGLALLQTAANPYVAIIGPAESTARRISFMGIANKTAGIMSQRILGAIFLLDAEAVILSIRHVPAVEKTNILDAYALKIVPPYLVITAVLLVLAVLIFFSKLPEIKEEAAGDAVSRQGVLQYPYLLLGVLALFFAAGCETIVIDGVILYGKSLGIPMGTAKHFTEYTLYATLLSYAASTVLIPRYLSQQNALLACSLWGIAMSLGAYFTEGMVSACCMMAMGLSTALLWGTIWGLSIRQLGKHTKAGSALLIMAVSGGATIPLVFGKLIDVYPFHPQRAMLILIPCFTVLLFFAVKGYRLESWRRLPQVKRQFDMP